MRFRQAIRLQLTAILAGCLACPPASALVTLNDSHDHIFVNTTFGVSHDSNIFATNDSPGDFVYSTGLTAEYSRRAGWIGVNASVSMGASRYGKVKNQNFSNPSYSLELQKQSGRTTGALSISAARESRADAAVNLRTQSWNYSAGLNFHYPIIERYSVSGGLGYSGHTYSGNAALSNLATYSANLDLLYLLPRERDLIVGYRYRYGETSRNTGSADHSLTVGVNGPLLFGLNGAVRVGYQTRVPKGIVVGSGNFSAWTANASTTYAINRKISLTGSLAKDFSTTATDSSVDSTTATLDAKFSYSRRLSFSLTSGWSDSHFLGETGRIVLSSSPLVLGPNRHDQSANWGASIGYSRSEHLSLSFGYTWFSNWSTISYADFIRTGWSLSMSSRW